MHTDHPARLRARQPQRALVFDLDGTLIDSAPSILAALEAAFAASGEKPMGALTADLIGPPLRDTLRNLLSPDARASVDDLVAAFKIGYDSAGYRASQPYPGISEWLKELAAHQVPLYLATNKRWVPTALILEHLRWRPLFRAAHALDGPAEPQPGKGELLCWMLQRYDLTAENALYIGDRHEDQIAAAEAGMPFQAVAWGYGHRASRSDQNHVPDLQTLRSVCRNWLISP